MATRWSWAAAPSDGTRLFYSDDDDSTDARSPVVLCDGIGCDGYVWRYLRRSLAPRRILHPHYRGHGRSQAPRDATRVTIPDLADDVAAVLDDAGASRAILVGHSMGVQVALETWRRHRDRVAALVLVCGASSHPLRTFRGVSTLEDLLPTVQKLIMRAPRFLNTVSRTLIPTRLAMAIAGRLEINRTLVRPEDFMPYLEGLSRMDVRVFTAILAAAGQHSADEWLGEIDIPTLVVAGGRDGFTPPARSRDMAAAIPGAGFLEVPDGSHTAPIERPVEIDAAIVSFASEIQ